MNPISFEGQNFVYAENDADYRPLACRVIENDPYGRVISCWSLTWAERIKVLYTGRVWHESLTFKNALQPLKLSIEKPEDINDE